MGNPNRNLSNTKKLILLDSLTQDFTMEAMYICISLKLGVPETPFSGFRTCFRYRPFLKIHTKILQCHSKDGKAENMGTVSTMVE